MSARGGMRGAPGVGTVAALIDEIAARLPDDMPSPAIAREIVAALLDVPRSWPVLNGEASVDGDIRERALAAADKTVRGAPMAYAVGRAAFRHLNLMVDERVLIPRSETEQLVEIVLELERGRSGGVAIDVGTGSGAIALSLAHEGTFDRVIGTDVSLDALAVARANEMALRSTLPVPVEMVHGSSLAGMRNARARVVVSNPPYIAYEEAVGLPASVRDWEPPVALFSGEQGMAATARLVREATAVLEPGGLLAIEVDARRASLAAELLTRDSRYREVSVRLDLFGRERFVTGRLEVEAR